jgi:SAM-dependent methyltransferase
MTQAEAPPLETRTLDHCLACGNPRLRRLPLRYEHRGSFPMVECAECGMRFLAKQPTRASLASLYSAEYFEKDFRCGRSESAYSKEAAFRAENQALLDEFETIVSGRRLVEIGCAGGWLLKHAAERGWQARGVELSRDAVAHARALGLDVFHGDLPGAQYPPASADLIYMGDVLEHVPDPRAVLVEAARVLAPGGALYLRGPTTTNSIARGLALAIYGAAGRDIVLREPPYHLWEFRPGSLRRLFEKAGLRVERMRESKIPPGRAHGEKSAAQRSVMALLDTLNLGVTRMFNAAGDRIVLVARKR